jgi:hypothetical protein
MGFLLSNGNKSLSDEHVMFLIHILCNSVKSNCDNDNTASEQQHSSGKTNETSLSSPKPTNKKTSPSKRAKISPSDSSHSSELSESLSLALLKNLSALLSKFQTEDIALEPLVELTLRIQPQHVNGHCLCVFVCWSLYSMTHWLYPHNCMSNK